MAQKKDWPKRFGRILRRLIKSDPRYGTQTRFALVANVDPSTVRRWISRGVRDITLIEEIANLFDMDAVEFLSLE